MRGPPDHAGAGGGIRLAAVADPASEDRFTVGRSSDQAHLVVGQLLEQEIGKCWHRC